MSAMKPWKAWLLVAVIFATGAALGAFGMRAYMARNLPDLLAHSRQRMEEHFLENIDREVGLSQAQKDAVLPILREAVQKSGAVHESVRGQIDAIMADADARIAQQLDAGQKEKFEAFRKRMEDFRRKGPPHGGPPPGGMPPGPPPGAPGFGGPPPPGAGPPPGSAQ